MAKGGEEGRACHVLAQGLLGLVLRLVRAAEGEAHACNLLLRAPELVEAAAIPAYPGEGLDAVGFGLEERLEGFGGHVLGLAHARLEDVTDTRVGEAGWSEQEMARGATGSAEEGMARGASGSVERGEEGRGGRR